MLLGIDCSAGAAAIALIGQSRIVERQRDMGRGNEGLLLGLIEDAAQEMQRPLTDLSAIGVGTGPGSFTGIRISVAASRGLGLALGIPVAGIDRFEALATTAQDGQPGAHVTVSLTTGRGATFSQSFEPGGTAVAPPQPADGRDLGVIVNGRLAEHPTPSAALIARLAGRGCGTRPAAPLYLAPPDAVLPETQAPVLLD